MSGVDSPMVSERLGSEARDSPTPSSSSSSSDEVEVVSLAARLSELSSIESDISTVLQEAALALEALNPAVTTDESPRRRDVYGRHSETFLDTLEVSPDPEIAGPPFHNVLAVI